MLFSLPHKHGIFLNITPPFHSHLHLLLCNLLLQHFSDVIVLIWGPFDPQPVHINEGHSQTHITCGCTVQVALEDQSTLSPLVTKWLGLAIIGLGWNLDRLVSIPLYSTIWVISYPHNQVGWFNFAIPMNWHIVKHYPKIPIY